ncbi:hypothetical protein [Burkholderia sp. JKS000303]|uniref:hypothetical protein n=1 Tax=Burkholderia sp. JKS000303 TaxID=1938747 RepID=UPI000BF4E439|nr:hypothetical protein [Burkholderia sp. JKS000303]PFH21007.1 hypothetical protein BX604_5432 [Burkholderia sp. JKS000303]
MARDDILRAGVLAAAFVIGAAWAASARADDCDDMPVHASKVAWAGQDLIINGVPTRAAMLTFDAPTSRIVDEFNAYWASRSAPTHAFVGRTRTLLSAVTQDCSYTLQIPTGDRVPTTGLFSAMRVDTKVSAPRVLGTDRYPLPPGRVDLDVTSHDANSQARTLQMTLPDASESHAAEAYAARLAEAGWRRLAQGPAPQRGGASAAGHAFAMQKNDIQLDASFISGGTTTKAVINVATHD